MIWSEGVWGQCLPSHISYILTCEIPAEYNEYNGLNQAGFFVPGQSGMACCTPKLTARRNRTWWCRCLSLAQSLCLGLARSHIWDQYQVSLQNLLLVFIFKASFWLDFMHVSVISAMNLWAGAWFLFPKSKSLVHRWAANNLVLLNASWTALITMPTSFILMFLVFQRLLRIPMERMTVKVHSLCSHRPNEATLRMSLCG